MGLSQDYKNRIKESMSLEEGGSLHAIADRAGAVNAPVLIIGLGGSGVDSLLVTKKMIYDTIAREVREDGTLSDKPKNIEYLGIDTDDNYRRKSYGGIRLNESAGELQIYTMPNVRPVLQRPELLPDYISTWLDCSIENDSVINGAGAVRQLGRLLLLQNIGNFNSFVTAKIQKVTLGFPADVPLCVFIIAGISGGTGSGTFIDVPYLVRAVSRNVNPGRPVQVIGTLFLPDVNAEKSGVSPVTKSSLYANGFAALKELDYLMNIEETGDKFTQGYGTLSVGQHGAKPDKPYDICLLMSSKDERGTAQASGDECYEMVTHVVAETIFNFVISDVGKDNFADFSINSWLSNENTNIRIYQTQLGDARHPVSYVYSIAGAASAKLPMDDVMSYLAYKMYQEVENFWNQRPDKQDVADVESNLRLTPNMIASDARQNLAEVDTSDIEVGDVLENNARVVARFNAALVKWEKQIAANLKTTKEKLEEKINGDNNIINQYFKDLEKGPVFAQQCLFTSDPDQRSVITDLRQYSLDFATKIPSPEQLEGLQQQVGLALTDLKKAVFKGGKLKAYLQKMNQLYRAKQDEILFQQLQVFCQNADAILTDKNNAIFDVVADLLQQMMPIFENYGAIKTKTETTQDAGGVTLSWSVVSTPDFIKQLEERMAHNPKFSVNLRQVVQNFYQYLFDHVESWKDENRDGVEELNSFIYNQFNMILDNSMDFFLELIANARGMTLDEYCDQIIRGLMERARVRYPINRSFMPGVQPPGYSFISIPDNSPKLHAAAQAAGLRATSTGGAPSFVKRSGVKDRIFMMNFMSATPLSLNADIQSFDREYVSHLDHRKGMHLFVPTHVGNKVSDIDWKKLPSPYPETEWVDFSDPKEHEVNERYRHVLAEAIQYGYVREDAHNRKLLLYYGTQVDIGQIAQACGVDLAGEGAIKRRDAHAFRTQIEALISEDGIAQRCGSPFVHERMVDDKKKNADGTEELFLKKSYEEMIFIQMYRPRDAIKKMVENHKACLEAIANVDARVTDENAVADYVKCRMTGDIAKHPKKIGVFIYLDHSGAAHDLIALSPVESKFPEYYLMKAFMGLPAGVKQYLIARAESRLNAGEDVDPYVKKLDEYEARVVKPTLENLKYEYSELSDGEKLLEAYQSIQTAVTNMQTMLNPIF